MPAEYIILPKERRKFRFQKHKYDCFKRLYNVLFHGYTFSQRTYNNSLVHKLNIHNMNNNPKKIQYN